MAGTNLGTAYVTVMPSAKGISGSISNMLSKEGTNAGRSAGMNIVGAIKGVIAGAAIGKFFKDALDAGGAMQQSFGGLETIYGEAAEQMKDFSYEAAKAGISANSYAEQAVSFGASLKQAYGTDLTAAAEAANTAILDMADNSAKMGTEIGSIQNAYQGFAKQNYTMLDNLKLGYGGTKKEMERLLEDAGKLANTEFDINNLGDVYQAIHVIQQELGLTGVAAAEAEGTFTGSMGSMKAAWENLKADMALGKDISEDLQVVLTSGMNFVQNNLLPMVGNVLKSIPPFISGWLTNAFKNLPGMVDSAISFINSLVEGIKGNGGEFFNGISELAKAGLEAFKQIDWIGLGKSILTLLVEGLKAVGSLLWDKFKELGEKAAAKFREIDWPEVGLKAVKAIGDAIGTVGRWIWDGLTSIANTAKEKFKDVDWAEAGQTAFHKLVDAIKAIGSYLWDAITTLATTAGEHFKDVDWGQVGQDIVTAIANGIAAIGGFLYEGLTTLATNASSFFTGINWETAGRDAVTFIVNGVVNVATTLWEKMKAIGEMAGDKMKNIDWKQLGMDILTAIKDGVLAIGSFLWGALQQIGEMAWNKFLELDWVQAGIDLVNGIIDGIKQFGSQIGETLLGFARDAWKSVKDFFAISSPSKLMRDTIGKMIPLGIAAGIESEGDAVTAAMDDIAADVATGFKPIVSAATPAADRAVGNNIVMNMTVNGAEDPEDWANRFARQLTMELRMA